MTTNYGPLVGQGLTTAAEPATFGSESWGNFVENISRSSAPSDLGENSGLYSGSLSAQGSLVAEQLNSGEYLVQVNGRSQTYKPFLTGYFRQYWKDPTQTTFGANTAIPAITSVMPDSYTDMPGSFHYYVDLQLTRATGSNYFDIFYFLNAYNQVLAWVTTANDYTSALKTAELHNLQYFGANSYQDLITQGFYKYENSKALVQAFQNMGFLVGDIPNGTFGTPNGIARCMINTGLGAIGNLTDNLVSAGVNFADIANPIYTATIASVLSEITNPNDLDTIQGVLETSVPNLTSPLDYCSISAASGLPNDSLFNDMAEVGADIYSKAPNFTYQVGSDVAALLRTLEVEITGNIEALTTNTSLLNPSILESLRSYLPLGVNNAPVTMLDVIGTASGYLTDSMTAVNAGINNLYNTYYGPVIRDSLSEISRLAAQVSLSNTDNENQGVGEYWSQQLLDAEQSYYSLISEIAANTSGNLPAIVNQINSNYADVCSHIATEHRNYNRANLAISSVRDNSLLLNFVSTLPYYAADQGNIGTDLMLRGMSQPNVAGETLKAVLDQARNTSLLSNAGVKINGVI